MEMILSGSNLDRRHGTDSARCEVHVIQQALMRDNGHCLLQDKKQIQDLMLEPVLVICLALLLA
jgi:hypothetical protein